MALHFNGVQLAVSSYYQGIKMMMSTGLQHVSLQQKKEMSNPFAARVGGRALSAGKWAP
jgi:hypothetical protein